MMPGSKSTKISVMVGMDEMDIWIFSKRLLKILSENSDRTSKFFKDAFTCASPEVKKQIIAKLFTFSSDFCVEGEPLTSSVISFLLDSFTEEEQNTLMAELTTQTLSIMPVASIWFEWFQKGGAVGDSVAKDPRCQHLHVLLPHLIGYEIIYQILAFYKNTSFLISPFIDRKISELTEDKLLSRKPLTEGEIRLYYFILKAMIINPQYFSTGKFSFLLNIPEIKARCHELITPIVLSHMDEISQFHTFSIKKELEKFKPNKNLLMTALSCKNHLALVELLKIPEIAKQAFEFTQQPYFTMNELECLYWGMIEAGVDMTKPDPGKDSNTPLMLAISSYCSSELALKLIDKYTIDDINRVNKNGDDALSLAIQAYKDSAGYGQIFFLASDEKAVEYKKVISALLEKGANINPAMSDGLDSEDDVAKILNQKKQTLGYQENFFAWTKESSGILKKNFNFDALNQLAERSVFAKPT